MSKGVEPNPEDIRELRKWAKNRQALERESPMGNTGSKVLAVLDHLEALQAWVTVAVSWRDGDALHAVVEEKTMELRKLLPFTMRDATYAHTR